MVAAQNMVQTLLDTDKSTKSNKIVTTIHHVKQPEITSQSKVCGVCMCVCAGDEQKFGREVGMWLLSRPDHRGPLFLYGVVGQGMTRGHSSLIFLCYVLVYIFYVGVFYDSQLEAADNRCL